MVTGEARYEIDERVRELVSNRIGVVVEARDRSGFGTDYLVEFAGGDGAGDGAGDGRRRLTGTDLEGADVGLRSYEHAENVYQRHTARENFGHPEYGEDPSHPDGCFFCGSHWHPSDCCPDTLAVDEYWAHE